MLRSALVLALSACVAVLGCTDSEVNRGDLNVFTLDLEWELGDELHAELAQQVELVDDLVVRSFVDRIGQDLAAATELADRPWSFHVVRDPTVNAFAIPGGHVYVHTGLIEAVESPSALAGVLAHEVAHVEARHSTEALTRAYGVEVILDLLGDGESQLREVAVDLAQGGADAAFSRGAEREADELAIALLAEAGWPPEGLAAFFEALLAEEARRPNALERFFATHPLTEERLEAAQRAGQTVSAAPPPEAVDPAELQEVQRRIAS